MGVARLGNSTQKKGEIEKKMEHEMHMGIMQLFIGMRFSQNWGGTCFGGPNVKGHSIPTQTHLLVFFLKSSKAL